MKTEKIILWQDPDRDEDQINKSEGLLEHLKAYDVEVIRSYNFMPMVLVEVTEEVAKLLSEDEALLMEDNHQYYIQGNANVPPGKQGNCS